MTKRRTLKLVRRFINFQIYDVRWRFVTKKPSRLPYQSFVSGQFLQSSLYNLVLMRLAFTLGLFELCQSFFQPDDLLFPVDLTHIEQSAEQFQHLRLYVLLYWAARSCVSLSSCFSPRNRSYRSGLLTFISFMYRISLYALERNVRYC